MEEVKQMNLFDLNTLSEKMSPEYTPQMTEKTLEPCLKKSRRLKTTRYMFLNLTMGSGNLLGESYWEMNSAWLGLPSELNFSGSPREEIGSSLLATLQERVHPKYYLSKKACLGILRRAKLRNKELPIQLKTALMIQAEISNEDEILMHTENIISLSDQGGERMDVSENLVATLRASMGGNVPLVMGSSQPNAEICEDLSPTITSSSGLGGNNTPLLFENNACDARYNGPLDIAPTLAAQMGTGGGNISLVKQEIYCIAANTINRDVKNGGNGLGVQRNISYTLTTVDIPAISEIKPYQEVVGALMQRDHKGVNTCYVNQDKCIIDSKSADTKRKLIRRLTPTECERLQGFPDNWTNIEKASDSPRYKCLGNSIAIPCSEFLFRGIAYFLEKQYEME